MIVSPKVTETDHKNPPTGRGNIEDASLKIVDINIDNWFGGANHDVSEDFTGIIAMVYAFRYCRGSLFNRERLLG